MVVTGTASDKDTDALSTGDVIYAVNGTRVRSVKELESALEPLKSGQPVVLQIERLGQLQFVAIDPQ